MQRLISSPDQAIRNIRTFDALLNEAATAPTPEHQELIRLLSGFRAWYALLDETTGEWRFGPSKWIGYVNMTLEDYISRNRHPNGLGGRETEAVLRPWFPAPSAKDVQHASAKEALAASLARFQKVPSRAHRISIIRHGQDVGADDHAADVDTAELLIRVGLRLPSPLRARVAAALSR